MAAIASAGAARASTCTLSGPLRVPTEAEFGPKRTVWKTLPKGTVLEVKGRDKTGVEVVGAGVTARVNAAVLDDVCALPIEPLTPPAAPPTPPVAPAPAPRFADHARVVLLGVSAPGVPAELVRAANTAMLLEARRDTNIEVIGPDDAGAVVDRATLGKAQRCDDVACVKDAAQALGAHQILTAAVDGGALRLVLLDVVNEKVLNRASRDVAGGLDDAARAATAAIYGVIGHIRLAQQPAGATVTLDGVVVGTAPVADLAVTKAGAHALSITGPGLLPWQRTVEVPGGADVDVVVAAASLASLEDQQLWWRVGAGGLGAAGLVAAGASALFYLAAASSDARLDAIDHKATQQELDAITGDTLGYFMGSVACGTTSLALVGGGVAAWFWNPATAALP